jgi:hypothetical protein
MMRWVADQLGEARKVPYLRRSFFGTVMVEPDGSIVLYGDSGHGGIADLRARVKRASRAMGGWRVKGLTPAGMAASAGSLARTARAYQRATMRNAS